MPSNLFRRAVAITATTAAVCTLALTSATAASAAVVENPLVATADGAALTLTPIGSHETGIFEESGAEIVHAYKNRLFVVNALAGSVTVLDNRNPGAPTELYTIATEGGVANSLAVRADGLGVVAVQDEDKTAPGRLVFFDADAASATILGEVTVGALPDMVTLSADGAYALVANEGEPADDFLTDPEGSVGVVALPTTKTAPAADAVRLAGFEAFEGESLPDDVRVFGPNVPAPDQGDLPLDANRVSRNLEPEYIAVDGGTAYASLQEANSLAVIDIATATVTDILPLGFKDFGAEGNGLDASDRDDEINIATYEGLYGLYMPDAVSAYNVGGETYLVTANEGDARADFGDFADESRVSGLAEDGFGPVCETSPLAAQTGDAALGRLNVVTDLGLTGEGDAACYEELYAYGGRSFSIWDAQGELVFDSGDDFEQITAELFPEYFNSDHAEASFDNRSDNKGPEPEGVTVGQVGDRTYAFIGLERVGGVMVYDITDPADADYVSYVNNRDFAADPTSPAAGDLGAEGLEFIPADESSTGDPLLAVANEVSGTTTLFSIDDPNTTTIDILTINDFHGRLERGSASGVPPVEAGAAVLAGAVDAHRAANPNTLFVSAGDNIGGSTFTSFSQEDNPTIDALVAAGLDVGAVGNHEFDRGWDDLENRVIPRFGGHDGEGEPTDAEVEAGLPFNLGANVYDRVSGEAVLPEYAIKTVDGVDIAFIGTVTPDTATMVDPAGIADIRFGDQLEAANRVAAELAESEDAPDAIVLLTHSGAAASTCESVLDENGFGALATGASAEIDAIVSAHTHQTYACEVPVDGTNDTRPVIQAAEYGKAMGKLELSVNPLTNEIISIDASTFPLFDAYPPNPEVAKIVADAVAAADVIGREPIGEISADILRGGTPPGNDRGVESSMGNWVSDVYLWAASEENPSFAGTPAEIAIMNPGGLRQDLLFSPDGVVTYKEAAEVQPFANTLVTVTLTGEQIRSILEDQWKATGDRPKLHLGVSEGFTYEYTQEGPRAGTIGDMFYQGQLIGAADEFTVVTNSFLANGGDGFPAFAQGTDRFDTGQVDLQATVDYFDAAGVVDPAPLGRAILGTGTPDPGTPGSGTPPVPVNPGGTPPAAGVQAGGTWAEVSLSNGGRVEQGGILSVTMTGLDAGQRVAATLFSDPIPVSGIPAADASGTVRFSVAIPSNFDLGAHRLVITSSGLDPISVGVTVVRPGALAVTGSDGSTMWGIAAIGGFLLLAGGAAFVVRRRRGQTAV